MFIKKFSGVQYKFLPRKLPIGEIKFSEIL